MAGRLSFSIAVNLVTEQFKKGANQVRASFQAIKAETVAFAAALGAGGVGLMEIVGRFVDVARETGRVTTALKNVSGGMAQYADNLSYITQLAKQYGLEVNALTGNFAKFTATADISGMSLANQRKIFESLSRACTAFGLSADQTNHVFTALSQMMSKGKISSEELRQQMGEQLPIALQAMAKAAGVPVIPTALKTDFLGNGKLIKDLGPIHRDREIYFEFGEPIMKIEGSGKQEQQQIIDFIESRLLSWGCEVRK